MTWICMFTWVLISPPPPHRAVMPGMVMFRRRWSVGSDDLVLPALFLFLLHCIWWVGQVGMALRVVILHTSAVYEARYTGDRTHSAEVEIFSYGAWAFYIFLTFTYLLFCGSDSHRNPHNDACLDMFSLPSRFSFLKNFNLSVLCVLLFNNWVIIDGGRKEDGKYIYFDLDFFRFFILSSIVIHKCNNILRIHCKDKFPFSVSTSYRCIYIYIP